MMYGVWNPPAVLIEPSDVLFAFRTVSPATGRRPDTAELARRYGVDEARIANLLAKARDAEHEKREREEREWNS